MAEVSGRNRKLHSGELINCLYNKTNQMQQFPKFIRA